MQYFNNKVKQSIISQMNLFKLSQAKNDCFLWVVTSSKSGMHVLLVAVSCFSFYYCLRKAMRTCCFLMDLNSDMVLHSSWIQQLKFGFYLLFKKEKKEIFSICQLKLLSLICHQKNLYPVNATIHKF